MFIYKHHGHCISHGEHGGGTGGRGQSQGTSFPGDTDINDDITGLGQRRVFGVAGEGDNRTSHMADAR